MSEQPEALRLAEIWSDYLPAYHYGQIARETDAELRRLHASNAELLEELRRCINLINGEVPASAIAAIANATKEPQ